ncbi:SMI1/KNR4 family protein, partial [Kitasatospora sp. NPDC059160]
MTAASPESPSPLQHPGITGEPADDDVLIEKLRTRAWDPGRRFDTASVPSAWIAERYGADWFDRPNPDLRSTGSDGTVQLRSSAEEVASYYADSPRGLLFPPVTMAEVEAVERKIGRRLPDVLRRIYTEVADGGFGPDGGLVSLREGNRAPGHLSNWKSAVSVHERHRAAGVPASWFFLT